MQDSLDSVRFTYTFVEDNSIRGNETITQLFLQGLQNFLHKLLYRVLTTMGKVQLLVYEVPRIRLIHFLMTGKQTAQLKASLRFYLACG